MGKHHSTPAREDPKAIHVPIGHVPYAPSLPGAMGALPQYFMDYWYYGGYASDEANTKQFSIVLWSQRLLIEGGTFYGVGVTTSGTKPFYTNTSRLGLGEFPTPTSTNWSTHVKGTSFDELLTRHSTMTCKLTSGTLGLRGAQYQVDLTDRHDLTEKIHVQVSLKLESTVGLVEEGSASMFPGIETIQFNMPAMTILPGSTITIDGETTSLSKGNIWLDRQSTGFFDIMKPLYLGNWLAITMNDGTSYTIQFIWPKKEGKGTQWIVGTDVGYPPSATTALEYLSLKDWDGKSPVQGVNVLETQDVDLNILNPPTNLDDLGNINSPHWKSSTNEKGNTYCTAWHLKIKDKVYKMQALVEECEVWLQTYFFEGAAALYDEQNTIVGYAMVEQMGYN